MVNQRLPKRFGRVIRKRREATGVSQEALADRAGLHRTYISLLERGLRNPSLTVIAKLAKALGTTITSIVSELESPKRW